MQSSQHTTEQGKQMKPEIYMHSFSSKEDICSELDIDKSTLEDCHVLLAYYHVGSWGCDSSSYILFEDKEGKLFENYASHCSCFGLEGQWGPEEVEVDYLNHKMNTEGILYFIGGYDENEETSKIACREVVDYLMSPVT